MVYCLTLRGWPDLVQDIPHIARHFCGARDELSIDNGLLLKGTRVCIPPELLERTLADLHGHIKVLIGCRLRQERLYIGLT